MITETLCEELCKLTEEEWVSVKAVIGTNFTLMKPSDEFREALRRQRQRTADLTPEELRERLMHLLE